MNPLECEWAPAKFLIFSSNVFEPLIYYSHLLPLTTSIIFGLLVLWSNPKSLINQVLFTLTATFSLWVYFDLILWATEKIDYVMYFWSIIVPLDLIIYILSFYLTFLFVKEKDLSFYEKLTILLPIVPILLFLHTNLNLIGFDLSNCDRGAIEGPLVQYTYFVELIFIVLTSKLIYKTYIETKVYSKKREIILFGIGILSLMILFWFGNITLVFSLDWQFEQYKLFGMPVFIGLLAYLIVKFKAFNIKLVGANTLVVTLSGLVGSLLFVVKSQTSLIIASITFVLSVIFGYFLIRSVRKEVEAREYIQQLAGELATSRDQLIVANEKLQELDKKKTEFVSIASHQLRSPLTAIKGYSSMILEGSFGEVGDKAKDAVDRIFQSSQKLVNIIEDFLNVTRIELGTMKYEMSEVNIKDMTKRIIEELKPNIEKRGLSLSFKADKGDHTVYADAGKISQVVGNVIDNAIKYTPKGTISITLTGQNGTVVVAVKDSGVGIPKETIPKLFEKFIRADDAGKTNISGTGLGLYVAKQIIESHHGRIWAESEGKGHGSTFFIELKKKW